MREKKLNIIKPSIKIVPLANGLMPDVAAKIVFSWFDIKYGTKFMPEPDEVEYCLRLIPVKLEIRNMLKGKFDEFSDCVDFLDIHTYDISKNIMVPSIIAGANDADNIKLSQIWQEVVGAIHNGIKKMAPISFDAANNMGDILLSKLLSANLDVTITAQDLRSFLIDKFEDISLGLEEEESSEPPIFAQLLLQEAQEVWPWLVADIGSDAEWFGETGDTIH